ncbi:hypothetical protein CLAIMM_05395 [Cladophialophora immunda]|nr:hypothetical protein CLAIMM_05395 [Cladophialophora immunda]
MVKAQLTDMPVPEYTRSLVVHAVRIDAPLCPTVQDRYTSLAPRGMVPFLFLFHGRRARATKETPQMRLGESRMLWSLRSGFGIGKHPLKDCASGPDKSSAFFL